MRITTRSRNPARPIQPVAFGKQLCCGIGVLILSAGTLLADDASAKNESTGDAAAPPALHATIDRLISERAAEKNQPLAPLADDAEFIRRVTLDLTGTIPTAAETRSFLDDGDADKRAKLIDRLLGSPEYARHFQRVFDVMLMRRLPAKHVSAAEWQTFLRESFAANKPWDEITREILSADGTDPKKRGPARFYLDREGEVNEITRDVARVFLGADLECAQCHDHPEIDGYKQSHYYGISAFLVRSFVFTDKKKKQKPVLAEKAVGEVTFESVFEVRDKTSSGAKTTLPRIFNGEPIEEVSFKKGEEYEVKPVKDNSVRPIPKFSRREKLAGAIASSTNRRFSRTTANRMWALMLGRGLIHPVDLDHPANPPSHPELLDALTDEFTAHEFDLQYLLRQIALSETYQRSSQFVDESGQPVEARPELFAQALLRPLRPAQFAWAVIEATGEAEVQRQALGKKLNEGTLYAKVSGHEKRFVQLFGGLPGSPPEDFESTADQVLFLSNDSTIFGLINSKKGNLADRLLKLPADDPAAIADELFISTLSRRPHEQDVADVTAYLNETTGDARKAAVEELVWALVSSSEFRFNH